MRLSTLAWRSTGIFTVMAFLEVMLHELAHAVTALALGGHPVVLFPGAATFRGLPDAKQVIVATAGPVFSLVLAGLAWLAYRRLQGRRDARMAALWLTFASFIGSIGYLILTPFSNNDLGGIAWYFHLAPVVRWLMFGAGIWAMTKIATPLLPALAELAPSRELLATPDARARYVLAIAVVPWLVFVAERLVVDLPLLALAILAPTLGAGIPLVSGCFDARKRADLTAGGVVWPDRVPWLWLAASLALVAFNRLVLHDGLVLG